MPALHIRKRLRTALLLGAVALAVWGARPAAAVDPGREVQEIGRWIRERQEELAPTPQGDPVWPVPGYTEVTSGYGLRLHPVLRRLRLHAGVDIGAPEGAPAVACLDGVVLVVASLPAYGQIVVIDHGGRLASVYAHLSGVAVREGERVTRGARVGSVGATGQVTGPHLHFELRHDGEPLDPAGLLDGLL